MTTNKNIETEVTKYLKGNYSKKVAFELLKRDGFTDEELQPFSKDFNNLSNSSDNSLSFFPGFLFLLLTSLVLLTLSLKSETFILKIGLFFSFILSLVATFYFHKKNKLGILYAAFQNVIFMLLVAYLFSTHTFGIINVLLLEFWLLFTLFSIKKYYTKIKQD